MIALARFEFPQMSQKLKGKNAIKVQFHVTIETFVNTSRQTGRHADIHTEPYIFSLKDVIFMINVFIYM